MKKLLLLLLLPSGCFADGLLSIPGLATAVADAAKSSKAVGLVDLNGTVAGGAFLPIRTLHDGLGINYLEVGLGGAIKQTEHLKPLVIVDFDLSAIVRKTESYSAWYGNHVTKKTLPDCWLGPYFSPASFTTWKDFKKILGGSISVGF